MSLTVPTQTSKQTHRKPPVLFLSGTVLFLLGWSLLHSSQYRERQLSGQTLFQLTQEVDRSLKLNGHQVQELTDPLLLYHTGKKLNENGHYLDAEGLLRQGAALDPDSPRLRDEWTKALLGLGRISEAFAFLKQYVDTHPHSEDAHRLFGKFYVSQNSMQRASEELSTALALKPDDTEALRYSAIANRALGNTDAALEQLKRATILLPKDAELAQLYAATLSLQSNLEKTEAAFRQALALAPDHPPVKLEFALFLLTTGKNLKEAETLAGEAATTDAENPAAQLLLGRARFLLEKYQACLTPLRRAAEKNPRDPSASQMLASACRKLNRLSEARIWQNDYVRREKKLGEYNALFQKLRTRPDDRNLNEQMAEITARFGEVGQTLRHIARARKLAPDAVGALVAGARLISQYGYAKEVRALLERTQSIAARSPDWHEARGNLYLLEGNMEAAGDEYNQAQPDAAMKARIHLRLKDYYAARAKNPPLSERLFQQAKKTMNTQIGPGRVPVEVRSLMDKAFSLEPTNREMGRFLLDVQIAQRDRDAAIATSREILKHFPNDGKANALLGILLMDAAASPNAMKEAEARLEAARYDKTMLSAVRYGSGLLALQRQQYEKAVIELREAAKLDPGKDVVYFKLSQALAGQGKQREAKAALTIFETRQALKRRTSELLGDIAQHPDAPALYEKAARFLDAQQEKEGAKAIRAEAARRFRKSPEKVR